MLGQKRNNNSTTNTIYNPVWQYIPLAEYHTPSAPARETIRRELVTFWERWRMKSPLDFTARFNPKPELRPLPDNLLMWAAPPPSSTQGTLALHIALQDWLATEEPEETVRVIVGTPGSGVDQIVREMARRLDWQSIAPPTSREILAGGDNWLAQIFSGRDPIVIPWLGKSYLRHQDGLMLMNRLLDWLETTDRRCLISCDSWAWAYLSRTLQIDAILPNAWTLAPFNAARLQSWLPLLARRTFNGAFVFRNAGNGQRLFPADNKQEMEDFHSQHKRMEMYADWMNTDYYLKQVAAHSRGIPGIAWMHWRQCLQVVAGTEINAETLQEAAEDTGYTVWVQPWSQMRFPIAPAWTGTEEMFVLHALLLHGGMSAQLLGDILPLTDNQVLQILIRLREAQLVQERNYTWQVSLHGYPAVRQLLAGEGYLVDHS